MDKKKICYIAPLHIAQGIVIKPGVTGKRYRKPSELFRLFISWIKRVFIVYWTEGSETKMLRESFFWLDENGNLVKRDPPSADNKDEETMEIIGMSIEILEPMNYRSKSDKMSLATVEIKN
jgi:hypothetical protein